MKRFFILFCLGGLTFNSITYAAESNSCKRNILDTADKIQKYFLFASDSTGNGINKKLIDDLFLRYRSDVLVGADTSDENFSDILAAAKLRSMKRHVLWHQMTVTVLDGMVREISNKMVEDKIDIDYLISEQ